MKAFKQLVEKIEIIVHVDRRESAYRMLDEGGYVLTSTGPVPKSKEYPNFDHIVIRAERSQLPIAIIAKAVEWIADELERDGCVPHRVSFVRKKADDIKSGEVEI